MYASRSAYWKETVTIIIFFLFEMIASSVPFITWLILYFMIEKQKSVKPETSSDHLVSGSNNLMEM